MTLSIGPSIRRTGSLGVCKQTDVDVIRNLLFNLNLPTQLACKPLHVPLGWHILKEDPLRRNPESQLNRTLLGNNVDSPEDEPFVGSSKGPQSIARRYKTKQKRVWIELT